MIKYLFISYVLFNFPSFAADAMVKDKRYIQESLNQNNQLFRYGLVVGFKHR